MKKENQQIVTVYMSTKNITEYHIKKCIDLDDGGKVLVLKNYETKKTLTKEINYNNYPFATIETNGKITKHIITELSNVDDGLLITVKR